ncbi:hypothetical protein HDU91_003697, partial [Kappamyces sp. JEL0680]
RTSVFGAPLETLLLDDESIPVIVKSCIQEVEDRGIYRKSGSGSKIDYLTDALSSNQRYILDNKDKLLEMTAVTSTLKFFFRELPDGLIPSSAHAALLDLIKQIPGPERTLKITALLKELPPVRYGTLKLLIHHLYRVQTKSDVNLMVANNLAVVFGPTIMKSTHQDANADIADSQIKIFLVEFLISNALDLFQ